MKKSIYETIIIIIGNFILALGICAFITPAGLITGGASGIGIAIRSLTGINISYTVYIINIIMFIVGYIYILLYHHLYVARNKQMGGFIGKLSEFTCYFFTLNLAWLLGLFKK